MQNKFKSALAGVLMAGVLSSTPALADSVGVTLGTGGLGAEWTMPVSERVQTRLNLSYMKLDADEESDGIEYAAEFDNVLLGALLDWHPFAGGFRLSTGMVLADFGIDLSAKTQDEPYEIGDNEYTGDLRLDGAVDFNNVAPYFGLGWGSSVGETGLSFVANLGVLLIGKPTVSLDASGSVSQIDPDTGVAGLTLPTDAFPEFQQDLQKERRNAEQDLEDFTFYPVLNLGMSFAF